MIIFWRKRTVCFEAIFCKPDINFFTVVSYMLSYNHTTWDDLYKNLITWKFWKIGIQDKTNSLISHFDFLCQIYTYYCQYNCCECHKEEGFSFKYNLLSSLNHFGFGWEIKPFFILVFRRSSESGRSTKTFWQRFAW